MSEIALHEVLLPTLAEFRKDYPKISVKITNESTPSALKGLYEGVVDFALVTTPIELEDEYECVTRKYRIAKYVWLCAKGRSRAL